MKIKVRTKEIKFTLLFPTALLCNRGSLYIALRSTRQYIVFTSEQQKQILALLKLCRKTYKGLRLVDVHTETGEIVEITL